MLDLFIEPKPLSIGKYCPEHPERQPTIYESNNETHCASARCSRCQKFLGWIGKKDLAAYAEALSDESIRLQKMLESDFDCQKLDVVETHYWDLSTVWEKAMSQLLPASHNTIATFGRLESIQESKVKIEMKSSTFYLISLSKIPELTKIFSSILHKKVIVELTHPDMSGNLNDT